MILVTEDRKLWYKIYLAIGESYPIWLSHIVFYSDGTKFEAIHVYMSVENLIALHSPVIDTSKRRAEQGAE